MNKVLSFLQRLYKSGKRYNEVILRLVIKKLCAVKNFSEEVFSDVVKNCRELAQSQSSHLVNARNYVLTKIADSSKKLIACIMNYKVVVKCKQGIVHFISKFNPAVLFRNRRVSINTGWVMLVSILLLLVLAEGENIEFAFAADNGTVNASLEEKSCEKDLVCEGSLVVDEKAAQLLQEINEDKFYEVILQKEQEEEIVAEPAINQTYSAPVAEEVSTVTESTEQTGANGEDAQVDTAEKVDDLAQQSSEILVDVEKVESINGENDVQTLNDYGITDEELTLLERIIEAEAGGEDIKGKILIANVVMNRVNSDEFPDNIEDVIMERIKGRAQFSPVSNGRLWSVTVSDESAEAAKRALSGEDYSSGALYFMARKYSTSSNVRWFDNNLDWLFKHGCHEFFR